MSKQAIKIIEDNLHLVWSERDAVARMNVIERIYAEDASLFHVGDKVTGLQNINESVTAVLKNLPSDFEFTVLKPTVINNDLGRAVWGAGPKGEAPVATGMDIVHFEDGKIKSLYVFLD